MSDPSPPTSRAGISLSSIFTRPVLFLVHEPHFERGEPTQLVLLHMSFFDPDIASEPLVFGRAK